MQKRPPPPPPPLIGRAGNLTIFITPKITTATISSNSNPGPVQAPPIRWQADQSAVSRTSLDSLCQFLWTALAKAQHVHSSLDYYMADWFGLDCSKYQRELDDYYETTQKPLKTELISGATRPKEDGKKIEAL